MPLTMPITLATTTSRSSSYPNCTTTCVATYASTCVWVSSNPPHVPQPLLHQSCCSTIANTIAMLLSKYPLMKICDVILVSRHYRTPLLVLCKDPMLLLLWLSMWFIIIILIIHLLIFLLNFTWLDLLLLLILNPNCRSIFDTWWVVLLRLSLQTICFNISSIFFKNFKVLYHLSLEEICNSSDVCSLHFDVKFMFE